MSQLLPFPESLCHSCAAPPRYVTSDRGSIFIYCPLFERYPPQPVAVCDRYRPSANPSDPSGDLR